MSPTELQSAIQALLSQQSANGGANADPVFAQELAKAGYGSNLPSMGGVGDIGIAGPNTGTITMPDGSKQIINYYVGGTNVGEYRTDDQGNVYSTSNAGDTNRIKPTGLGFVGDNQSAYITPRGGGEAVLTPPPTNNGNESWLQGLMTLAPVLLPAIGAAYAPEIGSFFGGGGTGVEAQLAQNAPYNTASLQAFDPTTGALIDQTAGGGANNPYALSQYPGSVSGGVGGAFGENAYDYANAGYDIPAASSAEAAAAGAGAAGGGIGNALMSAAGKFGTGLLNNPAPLVGAGLSTLGALYGANQIGKSATNAANTLGAANTNAANLASNASLAATDLQRQQFQRQQELQQPFYNAGVNALPAYASGVMPGGSLVKPFSLNDFLANQDPGQKYRTAMGLDAIQSTAVSKGLGQSGKTYLGLMRAGQDYASQEYQNAYNRYVNDQATQRNALAGLTGYGPTSASNIGAAGQNYASNVGNLGTATANTIGNLGTNTASQIANADLTGAAARQSAYGGAANAFNAALNPNPLNAFLARSIGNPYG